MMRQLTCTAPNLVEWVDVPDPELRLATDALIRPIAVARCEIDPLQILSGPVSEGGFALGHEAVAEVLAVGAEVGHVRPGDLVVPSFQISCGACPTCAAGRSANCDAYPVLSDYGMQPLSGIEYGGMLSDVVRVPHASTMLTILPRGIDPVAAASVADNVTDGYRGVARHLAANPGADVLVVIHGNRSIGLYAAQAAVALGAGSVTVASDDEDVLGIAERIGATCVRSDLGRRIGRWPIVVDCGSRAVGLHFAIANTQPEGVLQSVSYYPDAFTPMPLGKLYTLGISFHIGRAHSASLVPEVVDLVASGAIAPEVVTTSVIDWGDAPVRFAAPTIKLVVQRPRRVEVSPASSAPA
jgi:threonine dehydrogenase-like Zn-dependent dehydrogenase